MFSIAAVFTLHSSVCIIFNNAASIRVSAMNPEEEARQDIDTLLEEAGWQVQDYKNLNLGAALGAAIREFPLESGRADYLLFVDTVAVGAIEAKTCGDYFGDMEGQTE
jgi:type I restriction enzyme, R subunit